MKKRLSSKDHFEAVYLKHNDFYRINELPAERRDVAHLEAEHAQTIRVYSKRFFDKHSTMLKEIGMELEDIICISRIHLYKYLTLFSLKNNPEKLAEFVKKYQERHGKNAYPSMQDITKKDVSNFMSYLPQKLSDLLRLCNMKLSYITGERQIKAVFELPESIDESVTDMFIWENYQEIGARKLRLKEITELKRSGANLSSNHFIHNGKVYRSILIRDKRALQDVNLEDDQIDDIDKKSYKCYTPFTADYESLVEMKNYEEKTDKINKLVLIYKKMSKESKIKYLNKKISKAKKVNDFKTIRIAEELLRLL
jgi:hypothetical protein